MYIKCILTYNNRKQINGYEGSRERPQRRKKGREYQNAQDSSQ